MNRLIVTGRLTKDPEMRYTNSGAGITSFSIANNEGWGDKQTTMFLDCFAFAGRDGKPGLGGAIADNLRKGSMVLLAGQLQKRSWDAQDGTKRWATELKVQECDFLDPKEKRSNGGGDGAAPEGDRYEIDPDEIPF